MRYTNRRFPARAFIPLLLASSLAWAGLSLPYPCDGSLGIRSERHKSSKHHSGRSRATASLLWVLRFRGNKTAFVGPVLPENTATVRALLHRGANVNVRDKDGYTPLMLAALQRKYKTVKLLLQYGAHINGTDEEGNTTLMLIAQSCHAPLSKVSFGDQIEETGYLPIIRLLLWKHAAVNVRNKRKMTALGYAEDARSPKTVCLLKQAGAKG